MTSTTTPVTRPRIENSGRGQKRRSLIALGGASGRSSQVSAAVSHLSAEQQRFALILTDAVRELADEIDAPESQIRNLLSRLVHAGLLQQHRSQEARRELARILGPSLADLDPVPHATVEQARRLAGLRASLLRGGAFSTKAIADARGITPNNARQWISRHRKAHRLFTVAHEGETLVPAFLLDESLEPRPEARAPIEALRTAGEDGWALWAWFATPSAWLGGRVPAQLLGTDPDLVAEVASRRATAAA